MSQAQRVLLFSHDPQALKEHLSQLHAMPLEADGVTTTQEAEEQLRSHRYDALLMGPEIEEPQQRALVELLPEGSRWLVAPSASRALGALRPLLLSPHRIQLLAFSGSIRKGSLNRRVLQVAIQGARSQGAEVTELDLADFPMPIYNGDLEAEEGLPASSLKLQALLYTHHGLLIATPEYNGFMTPLLKNTLDWCSRAVGAPGRGVFASQLVALVSASGGKSGGKRSLAHTRTLLSNLGASVLETEGSVPLASQALTDEGLKEPYHSALLEVGRSLVLALQDTLSKAQST